jgi:hypothetical protein
MSAPTVDVAWMERDLYGYGPDRPDAKWPKGKKIAVNCELKRALVITSGSTDT